MSPSISNNLSVNLSRLFGQGRGLERTDGRMGRRVQAIAPHSGTTASLIYKLCIYLVLFFLDIASYFSKVTNFSYPTCIWRPQWV